MGVVYVPFPLTVIVSVSTERECVALEGGLLGEIEGDRARRGISVRKNGRVLEGH